MSDNNTPLPKDHRFYVTGGLGFLGSAMVWQLNRLGYENICIVDKWQRDDKRWLNVNGLRFGDIVSPQWFLDFCSREYDGRLKNSTVIHFGAISDSRTNDCVALNRLNYRYSVDLAEHLVINAPNEDSPFFVNVSSAATYGDGSCGFDDDPNLLPKLRPLTPYAFFKHQVDLKLIDWLDKCLIVKPFNIFGPNEYHKGGMSSYAYQMFLATRGSDPVTVYTHSTPLKRDFLYVKPFIRAVAHLVIHRHTGLFNIGSGHAHTWTHVLKNVLKFTNRRGPGVHELPLPYKWKDTYQYFTEANIKKLLSVFPEFSADLDRDMEDYIKNYLMGGKPRYLVETL